MVTIRFHSLYISLVFTAILWALSLPVKSSSQVNTDSLIVELNISIPDTHKVWLYRDLSYYFLSKDLDSALIFSHKGYDLASTINFVQGQIWNLYQIALAHEFKDDFDTAFEYYEKSVFLAEKHRDFESIAKLQNALGAACYYQGDLTEAVRHYNIAYQISDSIHYDEGKAHALNNLGIIYRHRRNYTMAIDVYQRSINLKLKQGDTLGLANTYYNLGLAHSFMQEHEKSLEYFLKAQAILPDTEISADHAQIDIGIGAAYYFLDVYDSAKYYLKNGLQNLDKRHPVELVAGMTYLGAIEVQQGNLSGGLEKIEQAYSIVAESARLDLLRRVLKERAIAYEQAGNLPLALESWKRYTLISDSLNNEQQQWALEEMQARFELKDKENTIALQNVMIEKNTTLNQLYFYIGLLLLILFVSSIGVTYIRIRISRKLKKAVNEKEWLLKEMHHRIKNNLQLLNSLLTIQSRSLSDSVAMQALQSSRNSVGAIGLIHHQLYSKEHFRNIEMHTFINGLFDQFNDAFQLKQRNIFLQNLSENISLDVDTAIPLGLIINELVTNALKHAFPENKRGNVILRLYFVENILILDIEDDGIGFVNKNLESQGFGSKMLKIFAGKLDAAIEHHHIDSGGTLIRYTVKNIKSYAYAEQV